MIFSGIKNPNRFAYIILVFGHQMPVPMFGKTCGKLLKIF